MLDLLQEFETITPLADDAKLYLLRLIKEEDFDKNSYLLQSGDVCRKLYFIREGLVYGYFKYRGRRISTRFAKANELCFVPESFIQQTTSKESLVAVTETNVYSLSCDALQDLYRLVPQFHKITQHYFLQDYIEANNCLCMFRSLDGVHRYQWLKDSRPDLLRDFPMSKTASYIGISSTGLGRFMKRDTRNSETVTTQEGQVDEE